MQGTKAVSPASNPSFGLLLEDQDLGAGEDTAEELQSIFDIGHLIYDHIQTGILIIDAQDLTILEANRTALEMLGTEKENLLGKRCTEHICDARHEEGCPLLRPDQGLANKRSHIIRCDGTRLPVLKTVVPINLRGRRCLLDCIVDISDQVQFDEGIRQQEEILRSTMDAAHDAIIMIDPAGVITAWNRAAERIFGWSKAEAIGRDLHMLIAPNQFHKAHKEGFEKFSRTGEGNAVGKTVELSALRKDGTEFPVEIAMSAIRRDEKWHAVGIVRDISDRKFAEERLREALDELEAILDSSLVGIMVLENRILTKVNQRMADMLGYTPKEMVGNGPQQLHQSLQNYREFGTKYYWRLAEQEVV